MSQNGWNLFDKYKYVTHPLLVVNHFVMRLQLSQENMSTYSLLTDVILMSLPFKNHERLLTPYQLWPDTWDLFPEKMYSATHSLFITVEDMWKDYQAEKLLTNCCSCDLLKWAQLAEICRNAHFLLVSLYDMMRVPEGVECHLQAISHRIRCVKTSWQQNMQCHLHPICQWLDVRSHCYVGKRWNCLLPIDCGMIGMKFPSRRILSLTHMIFLLPCGETFFKN